MVQSGVYFPTTKIEITKEREPFLLAVNLAVNRVGTVVKFSGSSTTGLR
jgi:hypothetical protein